MESQCFIDFTALLSYYVIGGESTTYLLQLRRKLRDSNVKHFFVLVMTFFIILSSFVCVGVGGLSMNFKRLQRIDPKVLFQRFGQCKFEFLVTVLSQRNQSNRCDWV